ncbi:MAG: tetratricopeptide repeat protein [Elusimicrobia bacterium]|nr:tetratricopeptide repeat protein [Elusimicrobiota bacterium]
MKNRALTLLLLALSWLLGAASAEALPTGASVLLYDSYAAEARGDNEAAISRMVTLLGTQPDDYLVHYRLGWLFSRVKKYKNAIDHYMRAAKAAPGSLEPWLALSLLNLDIGSYDVALGASNALLSRDPKNYYGLLRSAAALQALKRHEEALAATDQALELYPLDTLLLEKKGYLLRELGRVSESDQTLVQLLLLSPQNAYAKSVLKK